LEAKRTLQSPKIDGILDDECWNNVPIATDFIQIRPNPGKIETHDRRPK
jgi:hypothetical protein